MDTGRSPAPQDECLDIPTRQEAAPPVSAPSGEAIWPDLAASDDYASSFANGADSAGASPPEFPTQVEGYDLAYQEALDPSRAFWQQPNPVWGFPATMNGCAQQRFYLRWRPLDENAQIQATWTYNGTGTIEPDGGEATGKSGWMSSYGCTVPAFAVVGHDTYTGPGNPITDVVVELQVWTPTV